jgi:hypothetical protein
VTSKSPFAVTASRLSYQDLRGLIRSLSLPLPVSRSQVHLTSLAVKGWPSCHLTPRRSGIVSSLPSSFQLHPVPRSGTIDCGLFCATSWSNMTRLLKTPIIGRLTASVDSSSIDMLAGLSKWPACRKPPCFCAVADPLAITAAATAAAPANLREIRFIAAPSSAGGVGWVEQRETHHPAPNGGFAGAYPILRNQRSASP